VTSQPSSTILHREQAKDCITRRQYLADEQGSANKGNNTSQNDGRRTSQSRNPKEVKGPRIANDSEAGLPGIHEEPSPRKTKGKGPQSRVLRRQNYQQPCTEVASPEPANKVEYLAEPTQASQRNDANNDSDTDKTTSNTIRVNSTNRKRSSRRTTWRTTGSRTTPTIAERARDYRRSE
jgi:hypothetical protein